MKTADLIRTSYAENSIVESMKLETNQLPPVLVFEGAFIGFCSGLTAYLVTGWVWATYCVACFGTFPVNKSFQFPVPLLL